MFGTVLLIAATVMHLYVFWRAASIPVVRRLSAKQIVGLGACLWLTVPLARYWGHRASGELPAAVELVGMNWLATVFLVFVSMLAVDVATGFGLLFKRWAPALRGVALLAGVLLAVVACIQGMRSPVVTHHEVELAELPPELDGTVLVAVSDLHLGTQMGTRWLEGVVASIRAEQPDLVVLLGDIYEGRTGLRDEWLELFRTLTPPLGTWAVLGNHDLHEEAGVEVSKLEQVGVRVLRDRAALAAPGLVLAGVADLTRGERRGSAEQSVAKALSNRPQGATLLLSHSPWRADQAARAGARLMLSGHTHGGQVWPFGALVATRYPLLAGRYQVEGMTVLVCRGTGTWGPRMRLWQPGEIMRVTLRSKG